MLETFGSQGSAPNPAGALTALPNPLAGGEGLAARPWKVARRSNRSRVAVATVALTNVRTRIFKSYETISKLLNCIIFNDFEPPRSWISKSRYEILGRTIAPFYVHHSDPVRQGKAHKTHTHMLAYFVFLKRRNGHGHMRCLRR